MPEILTKNEPVVPKKFSGIQYFFWLVSGCEIGILKTCPTDYNRQAGIGFTIFMTTLFAAFAGGYAGFYFSKNIISALCFGLIWGLLVFSIDRTLVITLKKDPFKKKQPVFLPLIGRAVLASLIAFIISIPLELLVFKDQINIQQKVDAQNAKESYMSQIEQNNRVQDKKLREGSVRGEANQDLADSKNCENDPGYRTLKKQYEAALKSFNSIQAVKQRNENTLYELNQRPDNGAAAAIFKATQFYINTRSDFTRKKAETKRALDAMNNECSDFVTGKMKDYKTNKKSADSLDHVVANIGDKVDKSGAEMEALFDNSFIREFIALENAAYATETHIIKGKATEVIYKNGSLLFLLWLIRILFFVIEILPTVSKIATPIGAYDRAIYAREKDFEKELEAKTDDYLAQQKNRRDIEYAEDLRQEKVRAEVEGKLHDDLLREMASAQNEVGKKKIEAFKRKHLNDDI